MLDLTPRPQPFSNEEPDHYWGPNFQPPPTPGVPSYLHAGLFRSLDKYAPHLQTSFVSCADWWKMNWGTPEAHMFKFLIYRGIYYLRVIFGEGPEEPLTEQSQHLLNEAKQQAQHIWEMRQRRFEERLAGCRDLFEPFVPENPPTGTQPTSPTLWHQLDRIFVEYYGLQGNPLIGSVEDEAYKTRRRYARKVGSLLGEGLGFRAVLWLQKIPGCTSLPLLTESSVSAMWKLCCSTFYKKQLSLLHRWIEPFAEPLGDRGVGCDYVSSVQRFLRPAAQRRNVVFMRFYDLLMAWSAHLYLVVLLNMYLGPDPVVTRLAQMQLLRKEEAAEIRKAIEMEIKNKNNPGSLYTIFLSRSGLDFETKPDALVEVVNSGDLQWAMFDLTLGQRVKWFQLNQYEEVHQVRGAIKSFFDDLGESVVSVSDDHELWWDKVVDPNSAPCEWWISEKLRASEWFVNLVESWLDDSESLQRCMDSFESKTWTRHNLQSQYPVFSYNVAKEIMAGWKLQGEVLDMRREILFDPMPTLLYQECTGLGLFTTRMPRFSQLFFYHFNREQLALGLGQYVSIHNSNFFRSGRAYLKSGHRLESKCGLSVVWYDYVEARQDDFEVTGKPLPPFSPPPSVHHGVDLTYPPAMSDLFRFLED